MNYKAWLKKSLTIGLSVSMLTPGFAHAEISDVIRAQIVADRPVPLLKALRADFILHTDTLNKLYQPRGYQPIWVDERGVATQMAVALRDMLMSAGRHGLEPKAYWDDYIEKVYNGIVQKPEAALTFDLIATEALIRYSRDLSVGRFDPTQIDNDIEFKRRTLSDEDFLIINNAVAAGPSQMSQELDALAPKYPTYRDLQGLLSYFKNIKSRGGWAQLAYPKVTLQLGAVDEAVPAIRARLNALGYQITPTGNNVDEEFDRVLKQFQSENGLDADGVIGANRSGVMRSLNKTADERIDSIEAAMERLRWLPKNIESRYIFVNLAMTEFRLFDRNVNPQKEIFYFKTVNGQVFRRSPVKRVVLDSVILNPTWGVTDNIAVKDKLPMLRDDANYLGKHNMVLYSRSTDQAVDPMTVDWKNMTPEMMVAKYYIVQEPGLENALGVVKFHLSGGDLIYMHDTNERDLFKQSERHRSSGCIRLQYPLELAEYLLKRKSPDWTLDKIKSLVPMERNDGKQYQKNYGISLGDQGVPVYLMYLTVERGASGGIRFVDDVYGQDARLLRSVRLSKEELGGATENAAPYGTGSILVEGKPGKTQIFRSVRAIRCEVNQPGTCDKPLNLSLNKVENLPAGTYMLGFENSMYPDWVTIQAGRTTNLKLKYIQVPQGIDGRLRVYRDFSKMDEQKKMLQEMFYLKRHFYRLEKENFGDLYLLGMWERDYQQRFGYSTCSVLGSLGTVPVEAKSICADWKGSTSADGLRSLFNFYDDGSVSQNWVTFPGDVIKLSPLRYLVSGPVFKGDVIAVFPGKYKIRDEGQKDSNGKRIYKYYSPELLDEAPM